LRPTALGKATSDLMIRVASATALERYIAAEHKGTADPNTLEDRDPGRRLRPARRAG